MTVYATRLVNGTDSLERMRRTDAFALFPSGAGTARGGFRNDGGGAVTVNAGTMTVDVSPFMAFVDGGVSDAQGGYTVVSDTTETLTVSPGHASLSRTDVVIVEVRDTVHDGSGFTDTRLRILEGTPGAGVPALPTNALALRDITVPAGLSAGTGGLASGNLSADRRVFTTGLGGTMSVASAAERDALPATPGTAVYRSDTDQVEVLRAAGWTAHSTEATAPRGWLARAAQTVDASPGDVELCITAAIQTDAGRAYRVGASGVGYASGAAGTGDLIYVQRRVDGGAWETVTSRAVIFPSINLDSMFSLEEVETDAPAGSTEWRVRAVAHGANGNTVRNVVLNVYDAGPA